MSAAMPFTSAHVSSLAARAAELEQLGEERQDPNTLVRAARLYTLAVRIADDIDDREALPFMHSDLTRIRDELRMLATRTVAESQNGDRDTGEQAADATASMTRMFREVAVRIEQRLTGHPSAPFVAEEDISA